MQKIIKECQDPQIELNYDLMIFDLSIKLIEGFIVELKIINTKWFTEKDLKKIFEKFKKKYEHESKEITYKKSKENLKQRDLQRGY
ncbi:41791_t:CDS:2 [Gigaspora margarita]|uniref:41791_t:CDS:1 n=1 Tax=Gigaspora margarita TaxID=4874 RepID=A0ABN7V8Y0_GIGMA|nr:41791_t:CDS:2 [Gigaspora margarita]